MCRIITPKSKPRASRLSDGRYDARVLDRMYGMGVPVDSKKLPTDEDILAQVAMCREHGIEAWGYHADSREAAIRCLKFGFYQHYRKRTRTS